MAVSATTMAFGSDGKVCTRSHSGHFTLQDAIGAALSQEPQISTLQECGYAVDHLSLAKGLTQQAMKQTLGRRRCKASGEGARCWSSADAHGPPLLSLSVIQAALQNWSEDSKCVCGTRPYYNAARTVDCCGMIVAIIQMSIPRI